MALVTYVKITHGAETAAQLAEKLGHASDRPRIALIALADLMVDVASGIRPWLVQMSTAETGAAAATGTVTISSGSGTITATINGVAIAITWATSDTNSASLLAAAINASVNALVAGIVTATSALGVVTVTSVGKGIVANAITLAASGTGATASGARLTGGTNHTYTSYDKR